MESNLIESLGIYTFSNCLIKVPGIIPHLQNNDRIPLYDGELYIYDEEGYTNDSYIGSVKVQVKTSTVEDNFRWGFKFRINDLIKYMNDGGVLILAAHIKDRELIELYYRTLLPFQIKGLIPLDMNQKMMRIKLNRLPSKKNKIKRELLNFICLSRQQLSFVTNPLLSLQKVLEWIGLNYKVEIHYRPDLSVKTINQMLTEEGATIYFKPDNSSLLIPTNGRLFLSK